MEIPNSSIYENPTPTRTLVRSEESSLMIVQSGQRGCTTSLYGYRVIEIRAPFGTQNLHESRGLQELFGLTDSETFPTSLKVAEYANKLRK